MLRHIIILCRLLTRRLWPFAAVILVALLAAPFFNAPKTEAATGINEQVNYQGRLLTNTGAVVPDGNYNIEFKIVQDGDGCNPTSGTFPCSGTVKWTETRDSSNKVPVKNGYFSVYLGSVTSFGSSIDWNQDTLWLAINIGGTGTPSYDGVMKPLTRLSSTPYALNSKQLGGLTASQFVQLSPAGAQTGNISVSGSITGGTAVLQGSSALTLGLTGTASGAILFRGATGASGTVTLQSPSNPGTYSLTLPAALGASGDCLKDTTGAGVLGFGSCGGSSISLAAIGSSPNANGATLTGSVLNLEPASASFGGVVTTGTQTLAGDKTLTGATTLSPTTNSAVALTVNGTSGTAATAVSIVQSGNADALTISSGGTGNLLKITDSTATARDVLTIADGGATTLRNQTDSSTGFRVQQAGGSTVLAVDTSNARVNVGSSSTTAALNAYTSGSDALAIDSAGATNLNLYNSGNSKLTIGYVQSNGNWFTDGTAGDVAFRQTASNALLFGTNGGGGSAADFKIAGTTGAITFRNHSDSTAAFQVQNAAGTDIFTVDATNAKIGTSNQTAGSTNSSVLTFKSGDVSGATSNSGNVVIDSGSATGTAGNISIGTGAYAHNVTIGNTTGASNATLQAGSTSGTITLEAPTINIGNSGSVHNVTVGSNNSSSSTIIQSGSGDVTLTSGNGNNIIVGSATADTNQILLQLDSFSTFADTATCSTTTNQGGLYYNTASNVVRGCVNGNWEDMVSTAGLGLQLFGVLPDSGTNPGDLASVTGAQNGPCKVSVGANTSTVSWKSCTAYSGGRKVLVTAGTAATSAGTSATIIFQHLCLTGTDNQPALSAVAVEASNQPVTSNTTIVTAPILCLADIKVTNGSAVITTIYDTRTYTTSIKSPITVNTTNPTVGMLLTGTTTKGTVIPNATSPGIRFVGVIVASTGSTSTSAINAIMAVGGPVAVKAITGTNAVNDLIIGSATAGYATTAATKTAEATTTVFNVIGLTLNAWTGATACTANADACAGSLLFNFDRR